MRIPILSLLFVTICISTAVAQMPTNGLVAWYPFTGNAWDSSGNGNNGNANGATLTKDRYNHLSSAYHFNGNSSSITGATVHYPLGSDSRTVSLWFTADAYPSALQSYTLVTYGSLNQTCGSVYGSVLWNQPVPTTTEIGTWYGCNGSSPDRKVTSGYNLNTWYHMVTTYDSGFQKIYLNDTLIDTATVGTINTQNDGFSFGKAMMGNNYHLGNLDDIAVYSRALSRCEVHKLFDTTILAFTQNPQSVTSLPGTDTIFTAHATAGAQYHWQVNTGTGFVDLANAPPYSGVNTDTLRITTITEPMNNNRYRAISTYPGGACTDTSASAILTVVPSSVSALIGANLSVYPNPFSTDINVTWTGPSLPEGTIRLTDITGRVLWQSGKAITNGTIKVPTASIAPGFYTINIYNSNTLLVSEKLVKQ